ncbi:MAG: hypothetical protein JNL18_06955 [Planctomycetaceae bacterium]|nr:hypothetical protein [Planctomycetaceae bacterium]
MKMAARSWAWGIATAVAAICANATEAHAQMFINELFFDPPGSAADATHEYVELRGTPGASLANHYLIFVENEDNLSHTGGAGLIELIFDLGSQSLGSNGFLTLRQKANQFSVYGNYAVDPAATDLQNTGTGVGYGSGAGSSIGASNVGSGGAPDGRIENSGFTAMLIRNGGDPVSNAPTLGFDLDVGNNGLDVATGRTDWTILDSIGIFSERFEAWDPDFNVPLGRLYGAVNFGPETAESTPGFVPNIEPGTTYLGTDFEIEIAARWGNSTGQAPDDWHISNATDNSLSGFTPGGSDFRQSVGDPHPTGPLESTKNVPYGAVLTNTLGSANYPLNVAPRLAGDFDQDGHVDDDDLNNEWKLRFGVDLDGADFLDWQANYGSTSTDAVAAIGAVPEPAAASLLALAIAGIAINQRRDNRRRG